MKKLSLILMAFALLLSGVSTVACGGDKYELPDKVNPGPDNPGGDDPDPTDGNYFADLPAACDPRVLGTKIAEHFIVTRHSDWGDVYSSRYSSLITYPDVCAWLGALWFAESSGDDDLWNRLADKFDLLFTTEKSMQPALFPKDHNKVDFYVFGAIPLNIYQRRKDSKYLELGLKYADGQYSVSGDFEYTAEHMKWHNLGYSWQTRLWIDDMFMITALQMQAFLATGQSKYMKRAAEGMVLYLDELQEANGLFYHAGNAPFYWARGDGWMAVGMTEVLRLMPRTAEYASLRSRIEVGYKKMMAGLLRYQAPDGMWTQLIDEVAEPDMWKETSGTAMFAYAFIEGVRNGWLDAKTYGPAARKAWITLRGYLDGKYEIKDVCTGTGTGYTYEYYRDRAKRLGDMHGQAAMMWSARAVMETLAQQQE
jgi:rhamnogalacturonyl hydrolase YesR